MKDSEAAAASPERPERARVERLSGSSQQNDAESRQSPSNIRTPEELGHSPEPSIMSLSEAATDLGDEYGIAASLERGISALPEADEFSIPSPVIDNGKETYPGPQPDQESVGLDGGTETPTESEGLARAKSPLPTAFKEGANAKQAIDISTHRMHKFSLYETVNRYYLVGSDLDVTNLRILKIDRTGPPGQLNLVEDETVYTQREMNRLLNAIDDGNKNTGGMKLKRNASGLLGFIRFTEAYYMLLVTKKQPVAMIGGHFVYQVDGTELIPLTTGPSSRSQANRSPGEQRYVSIFKNLDLNHSFYFSYSYNVTRTMQHNIVRDRLNLSSGEASSQWRDFNDMFVWNHHLLDPAMQTFKNPFHWCLPIIHGSVDQSCVDMFGRSIYITLIARRSRFFAGARFHKRGSNDLGYVANDVETEQIVTEMVTTSLHAHGHRIPKSPSYSSFVQHRGSIPLYWSQDSAGVTPKPGIELNFIDPWYSSAALHFDNLFERYGAPVIVLNLIRTRERTPRESKLLVEYQNAIRYLNQSLPEDKKIQYRAFDMAKAAKTRGQDVIGSLEVIAEDLVRTNGFFHNGISSSGETSVQNGVTRSNCIDCLDRTNACQFVIGKTAFALQLQALGLIAGDSVDYDSDASNILAHMYNDHGDTLASQYGGSHLVNTTDSYRKINNWQSHSRDVLESFKRYYHNSFLDSQRQEAYNLFLGNYTYASGQPMLWELPNDYYLHHTNPKSWADTHRRDYNQWFTPKFLETRTLPIQDNDHDRRSSQLGSIESDWWQEYYKPSQLTSFAKTFAYKMNSTTKYLPKPSSTAGFDRSPFVVRRQSHESIHQDHRNSNSQGGGGEGNLVEAINPLSATSPPRGNAKRISSIQQWLQGPHPHDTHETRNGAAEDLETKIKDSEQSKKSPQTFVPGDKNQKNQWTLRQFHENSLNPSITEEEGREYRRYVSHPLKVPLVLSSDPSYDNTTVEFEEYLETTNRIGTAAIDFEALDGFGEYERWLTTVPDDALSATGEDLEKKRYQAYRKWLRGKSLFKQSKVDPEYGAEG